MPRVPFDAKPETQRSIRELQEEIDKLKRANITDLKGRRISNTGRPKERRDYANKGYIDDLINQVRREFDKDLRALKRQQKNQSTGSGGPSGACAMDLGYWYVDTMVQGQYESTVKPYTNLAVVFDRDGGDSSTGDSDRMANITSICSRLSMAGFKIALDVGPNAFLEPQQMLDAAKNSWASVTYVLCGDEPDINQAEANALIADVKARIAAMGLASRPLGVTVTVDQGLTSDIVLANWDFVNIEAYTQPCTPGACGASTAEAEIAAVKNRIMSTMARIPAAKNIGIVMQSYDRNGSFTNITILAALNAATYFQMAKGNPRVIMINMFAYSREGGAIDHDELVVEHKKIWADCRGGGVQPTGTAKNCAGIPCPDCLGVPVCCEGGTGNPCNCPRLCEGGAYMQQIETSTINQVAAHPELFQSGTQILLGQAEGILLVGYITAFLNSNYPTLKSIPDPADAKQALVRQLTDPQYREDYRIWNTDFTIALPSGSGYRATCYCEDLTW